MNDSIFPCFLISYVLRFPTTRESRIARLFSNTFHFIDDLCVINDFLELEGNFKNIYPSELQVNKKNISTCEASFLDLSIIIENKEFTTQLYDNRNAFPFSIIRMLHLDCNTSSNVYNVSTGSEILRFSRTSLDKIPF